MASMGTPPGCVVRRCGAVKADYPESVKQMLGPWGMVNVDGKRHTRIK
jgi:hypothetical protein